MKVGKIVRRTLLVVAALLLLLVLVVLFWLGPSGKAVAQRIGSKALGTPVIIESLSINPRKGTIDLAGFQIATHEGFSRSNTVSLASLQHVSVDMRSLFADSILVHEIRLESPHFTFEHNSQSDNITEKIRSILAFAEPRPKKKTHGEDPAGSDPRPVIVEQLKINDIQAHLANTDDPDLDIRLAVEQLSLSLTNGIVQIRNLAVSNPGRLKQPHVFDLESIAVRLDPATLYAPPLVILDVRITKPHAYLERNPQANTVGEFLKETEALFGRVSVLEEESRKFIPEEAVPQAAKPTAPPPELHTLRIEDIRLMLVDTVATNASADPKTVIFIDHIAANLAEGSVHVGEIALANRPGFTATNLLHLGAINIALDPATLTGDHIVIHEALIDSPDINLERTKTTGNIAELQKLAESFMPAPTTNAAPPTTASAPQPKSEPAPLEEQPVILHELVVTNFSVHMISPPGTNSYADNPVEALGKLNPLGKVSLDDLNPLTDKKDTNTVERVKGGPLTLVAFDRLKVEPLKLLVTLDNLQIGNPEGFAGKNLVELDSFKLEIDPDTLQSDIMVIRDILINNPTITYERKLTTDNIKAMQQFIEKAVGQSADKEKKKTTEDKKKEPGQKVIIDQFALESGLVKAKLSALPAAPIPLPPIKMRDIGRDTGGTSLVGAVTEIGTTIYDSIIGAVSGVTGFAGDMLKGTGALVLPGLDRLEKEKEAAQPAPVDEEQPKPKQPTKPRRRFHKRPGRMF
jgi:uncharacterized protein involved in outer membrane biogenesis